MYFVQLCRSYTETGLCNYGKRCRFIHTSNTHKPIFTQSRELEKKGSRRLSIFQQLSGAGEMPRRQAWKARQATVTLKSRHKRKWASDHFLWSILYILLRCALLKYVDKMHLLQSHCTKYVLVLDWLGCILWILLRLIRRKNSLEILQ